MGLVTPIYMSKWTNHHHGYEPDLRPLWDPIRQVPPTQVHPTVHHYPSLVKTASQQVHSSLQQALRWSKDCQQFSVSPVACPSVVATATNEKTWIFSQTPSRSMGGLSHSQWECIHKPLLGLLLVGEKKMIVSPFFTAVDCWKPTRSSQTHWRWHMWI